MNQERPVNTARRLTEVLDLAESGARTTEDIFTGTSLAMPHGRIFGGQVLAQTIVAAQRTVDTDRVVHSMHGYFLRPGDDQAGLTISVDRIHDGRSFSTRRAQAYQDGKPIFSMIASFQLPGPGLEHQERMPDSVPEPETLPDPIATLAGIPAAIERAAFMADHPIETRYVESPMYVSVDGEHVARQAVWIRIRHELPDEPLLHRAALAFMSDHSIQDSVLRAHGVPWATDGLKVASLDHAMWWHRDARADEWLLYVQESPNARGGRGLATGRMYSRDGALVATIAQEIMVHVPRDRAAD